MKKTIKQIREKRQGWVWTVLLAGMGFVLGAIIVGSINSTGEQAKEEATDAAVQTLEQRQIARNLRANREICERLNATRMALFDTQKSLVKVNLKRAKASNSRPERRANYNAARVYLRDQKRLLRSTRRYRDIAGRPHIDCNRAFPELRDQAIEEEGS